MNQQLPCSDYVETYGLFFFARMVDKIRLHAQGLLPADYNLGFADPTSFDARFCRFWEIDYEEVWAKTLEGIANEAVFDFCFRNRKRPNEDQVEVWNNFLAKRGWRDNGAAVLEAEKQNSGLAAREDVQTWVDLHDAEEGRPLRYR